MWRVVLESFVKREEARRFAVGRKPHRAKADATRARESSPRATPPGGVGPAFSSAEGKTPLVGSRTSEARASKVARVVAGVAKRSKRSRNVPAAVRRAVYLRDCGQCSFVSEDGRRCAARALLELDHVEPWAKLGGTEVDNIRLRCRAHNQLHARECFGARQVDAKIAERRNGASPLER